MTATIPWRTEAGEVRLFRDLLQTVRATTDVFGPIADADELRAAYRKLSKVCHPDRFADPAERAVAEEAFRLLTHWRDTALEQLGRGAYGEIVRARPITLRASKHSYRVEPDCAFTGAFSTVYRAMDEGNTLVAVKIASRPGWNTLLQGEQKILDHLEREVDPRFRPYFPILDDHFLYDDGSGRRAVNVMQWQAGAYTLEEVRAAYPQGIDPKDAAWIFRRLLVAVGAAHQADVLHGAVLPSNVLLFPAEHGLVLLDWTCAVPSKEGQDRASAKRIPALDTTYEAWYPPEVPKKEAPSTRTDIYLAARCLRYLLEGQGTASAARLRAFANGCAQADPRLRPDDAWRLKDEFDRLLERLWGKRTFHPFAMPSPSPR